MLKIKLELLPEDRQPKNSYRYGFKSGDAGIDTIYIKKAAFTGKAPRKITVTVDGEE